MLKECKADGIIYEKDGEQIELPTLTTVWAAGVKANSIVEASGFETNRGKVEGLGDMRTPGYDDVFVFGDCGLVMRTEVGCRYVYSDLMGLHIADVVAVSDL